MATLERLSRVALQCLVTFLFTSGISSTAAPCATIASSYSEWASSGGDGNFAGIPGKMAHECLRSMPFHRGPALRFLDEYAKYIQFHSTLEELKHPPPGYLSPSMDIMRGVDKIRQKTLGGSYSSHFSFDSDLNNVISRANDGHLKAGLCSQEIFHFEHGLPLVSVSRDGIELPRLYTYSDAALLRRAVGHVSPVVEINNVDAVYFLQAHIAITLGYQDPDARYNRLFPSSAANFSGAYSGGAWTTHTGLWPGSDAYTIHFANGTELQIELTASWPASNGPMTYKDGKELLHAACLKGTHQSFGTGPGSFHMVPTFDIPRSGPSAFPKPLLKSQDGKLQGHFLSGIGVDDVGVLQIPTFYFDEGARDFAETATAFIRRAASEGRSKLILDLSGNDGGDIIPGFNLFTVLFPHRPVYSGTRFHATETIRLMGEVFSATHSVDAPLDPPLVYSQAVDADQQHSFHSWEALYGPQYVRGSNMSRLYAHFDFDAASTETDPISGFGGIEYGTHQQMFHARDIVIVTDGHCASTCAVLVTLLKAQGVRSIVFGGRPRPGPMQAVGGNKGAQKWSLRTIDRHIKTALGMVSPAQARSFAALAPPGVDNMALRFDAYGESSVNFRSAYSANDAETPLQFVYEAADCRRFFTAENIVRPETVWVDAAKAMFGRGGACVPGSFVD